MAKVIVAMSGGVDSSVAAALLKEQGHEVQGIFMKNWSPETIQTLADCPWEQDQADAAAVCEVLGIPFRSINFEKEYKERVVDYFIREYALGRTPNPDIMCNKEIKFAAFLEAAKDLGADYIATGHYARVGEENGKFRLLRGLDTKKDQSYFLYTLGQEQLSKTFFPVGELPKERVRELAVQYNLPTAAKKDSQGICFIGHIDLKKFLMSEIAAKPGLAYLIPPYQEGESLAARQARAWVVGKHQGSMFYTIGERAGAIMDNGLYRHLNNGVDVPPTYILAKRVEENRLYITDRHDDPHFYAQELLLEDWAGDGVDSLPSLLAENIVHCQVRYQEKGLAEVATISSERGIVNLTTKSPVWAPASGQSVVVYAGERLLGGGVISQVIHN
jgi:tRNA-specific 2-thiouridylase